MMTNNMLEFYLENSEINEEEILPQTEVNEEDETLTDYILRQKREAEKQQGLNRGRLYFDETMVRPYDVTQGTITTSNRTIFPEDYLTPLRHNSVANLTSSMTQAEITAIPVRSMIEELERRINELEIRGEGVFTR